MKISIIFTLILFSFQTIAQIDEVNIENLIKKSAKTRKEIKNEKPRTPAATKNNTWKDFDQLMQKSDTHWDNEIDNLIKTYE